jgi:hypothetical protein
MTATLPCATEIERSRTSFEGWMAPFDSRMPASLRTRRPRSPGCRLGKTRWRRGSEDGWPGSQESGRDSKMRAREARMAARERKKAVGKASEPLGNAKNAFGSARKPPGWQKRRPGREKTRWGALDARSLTNEVRQEAGTPGRPPGVLCLRCSAKAGSESSSP